MLIYNLSSRIRAYFQQKTHKRRKALFDKFCLHSTCNLSSYVPESQHLEIFWVCLHVKHLPGSRNNRPNITFSMHPGKLQMINYEKVFLYCVISFLKNSSSFWIHIYPSLNPTQNSMLRTSVWKACKFGGWKRRTRGSRVSKRKWRAKIEDRRREWGRSWKCRSWWTWRRGFWGWRLLAGATLPSSIFNSV